MYILNNKNKMAKKKVDVQKSRHVKKMSTIIALTFAFTVMVGNQMHSIKSGTLSVDTFGNTNNSTGGGESVIDGSLKSENTNKELWNDIGTNSILEPIYKPTDTKSIIDPVYDGTNAGHYELDANGNKIYKTAGDKTEFPNDKNFEEMDMQKRAEMEKERMKHDQEREKMDMQRRSEMEKERTKHDEQRIEMEKRFEEDMQNRREFEMKMDKQREEDMQKHSLQFTSRVLEDVDRTKREMEKIGSVLSQIKASVPTLGEDAAVVLKAVNALSEIQTKSASVLVQIETSLGKSGVKPEDVEGSWQLLDNVGRAAENHMAVIMRYQHKFPQDVQVLIRSLHDNRDNGNHQDKFDVYTDLGSNDKAQLIQKIRAEVLEEVTRQVTGELMAKVADYIGDDAAGQIMSSMMNNIDIFGDRGSKLLNNSTDVNDALSLVNFNKAGGKSRGLAQKTKQMMILGDVKIDLEQAWADLKTASDAGDTSKVTTLETKIEGLLNKNEDLSIKGDDAYQFADVRADKEDWFFRSVMAMKEKGIVSGYKDQNGNATGEFGPSNNVTVGESLKMAFGAANVPVNPQGSGGHWAVSSGYVGAAQNIGLAGLIDLSKLDRPASREDVAVITAKAFGLDASSEYKNAFTDYKGSKGNYVQATYDAGIFTGEGDTGKFNGNAPINRASIAKVINAAIDVKKTDDVSAELDNFKL